jgi:hypothetical protein
MQIAGLPSLVSLLPSETCTGRSPGSISFSGWLFQARRMFFIFDLKEVAGDINVRDRYFPDFQDAPGARCTKSSEAIRRRRLKWLARRLIGALRNHFA